MAESSKGSGRAWCRSRCRTERRSSRPSWRRRLAKNPDTVAVFATLSETSTGVGHDIEAFGRIVAKTPALLAVDAISGLGAMECRTDDWHIDLCVTGSQKALAPAGAGVRRGRPEGLVGDRGEYGREELLLRPEALTGRSCRRTTPRSPRRTRSSRPSAEPQADSGRGDREPVGPARPHGGGGGPRSGPWGWRTLPSDRTTRLTVIKVPPAIDGNELLKNLEKKYGYKLANRQDTLKGRIWRLSHMGYCDAFDVIGACPPSSWRLLDAGYKLEPRGRRGGRPAGPGDRRRSGSRETSVQCGRSPTSATYRLARIDSDGPIIRVCSPQSEPPHVAPERLSCSASGLCHPADRRTRPRTSSVTGKFFNYDRDKKT